MIIHLSKMIDPVMYPAIIETKNWHLPSLAGAFSIFKRKKVPADLDDFDLEDEEEYLTEDEKMEEKNE